MDEELLMKLMDVLELYFLLGEKTNSRSVIKTSSDISDREGGMDDYILIRLKLLDFIDSILGDAGYSKSEQ